MPEDPGGFAWEPRQVLNLLGNTVGKHKDVLEALAEIPQPVEAAEKAAFKCSSSNYRGGGNTRKAARQAQQKATSAINRGRTATETT